MTAATMTRGRRPDGASAGVLSSVAGPRSGKSPLPSGLPRCARNRATSSDLRGEAFPFSSSSGPSICRPSLNLTTVDRPERCDPSSQTRHARAPVAACYRGSVGVCSGAAALTSSAATAGAGDGLATVVVRAGPGFSTSPGWTFRGPDCSISLLISASGLVAQPASSEQSRRAREVDTRIFIWAARLTSLHDSASRNPGEQPHASA